MCLPAFLCFVLTTLSGRAGCRIGIAFERDAIDTLSSSRLTRELMTSYMNIGHYCDIETLTILGQRGAIDRGCV